MKLNKLALGVAFVALSVPALSSAAQYDKSIVLDARGNGVKTIEGVCVTHNYPEVNNVDCVGSAANIVYFGLGSSKLNAAGKEVLDNVAKAVEGDDSYSINLKGHADRKGNAAANQRLSERRVEAVKKALVARGVKADAVTTETFGEDANAVPTEDNVAEKLNRRVEIQVNR